MRPQPRSARSSRRTAPIPEPAALAAPCRSFNAAIAQTSAGGEVVILDTAGYGTMSINKSIKVIGPSGVYGGISVLGGAGNPTTGIVINAGDNDDVILRGLDIIGRARLGAVAADRHRHPERRRRPHREIVDQQLSRGRRRLHPGRHAKTVRVYVDDSFLRHCLTGIYANGNVVSSSRSALIVDNTRIERGFNANPASLVHRALDAGLHGRLAPQQRDLAATHSA